MKTARKFTIALAVLMVAGMVLSIPSLTSSTTEGARGHTPSGSATCNDGVKYAGTSYPPGSTVTVTIDSVTYVSKAFSGNTSGTVPNPDKTVAHNWSVTFTGSDGQGSQTFSGKIPACQPPVTTTTVAATTTTVAVTTTTAPTTTTPAPTTTAPTATTVPAPTTTAPAPTESSAPASSTPATVPTPTTAPRPPTPSSGPLIPETE